MGSEVRLVAVVDKPGAIAPISNLAEKWIEDQHQERPTWITEFVDAAAKQLRSAALTVSSKVEAGDPKLILVTEAEEWGADCIFLGSSSSRNHLQSLLLGSVATAIVARAHCSVEILRPQGAGKG
jgi:nucleotide-binding universal stress UspA family protein